MITNVVVVRESHDNNMLLVLITHEGGTSPNFRHTTQSTLPLSLFHVAAALACEVRVISHGCMVVVSASH